MLSVRRMSPCPSVTRASRPPFPTLTLHDMIPLSSLAHSWTCHQVPCRDCVVHAAHTAGYGSTLLSLCAAPMRHAASATHWMLARRPGPCESPLTLYDVLQSRPHIALRQGREAEFRASGLQSRNDLPDVVADEAETCIPGVFLDHCTRSRD